MATRRLAVARVISATACTHVLPKKVPGETDIRVRAVELVGPKGTALSVKLGDLRKLLGQRAGSFIDPVRRYNPYRVNEDRRRVAAWWQNFGRFDVVVDKAQLTFHDPKGPGAPKAVTIRWVIHEGPAWKMAAPKFRWFRPEHLSKVRSMAPFGAGDSVDLQKFRLRRWEMADWLGDQGFAHARVYSRAFVDKKKRVVHWFYYADYGPETRVKSVQVHGANRVAEADIIGRIGLQPGQRYGRFEREQRAIDLLDTGAFYNVRLLDGADIRLNIGLLPPDTGGIVDDARIRADGTLIPRDLPTDLDVVVQVVESPAVQTRVDAGVEADPTRMDAFAGLTAIFRNALGSLHHLTVTGDVGYGYHYRGQTDEPIGVYGDAVVRYDHPGALWRTGDLRLEARLQHHLYPGYGWMIATAGPGLRSRLIPHLLLNVDLLYAFERPVYLPTFATSATEGLSWSADADVHALLVRLGLMYDTRDDRVEAKRGHVVGVQAELSPGGAVGTHRWLKLSGDLRAFFPLGDALSLGFKAQGGFTLLAGKRGVPGPARWFGGGAFGNRAYGYQAFSPTVEGCRDGQCQAIPLGGLSLFEASAELRWLPALKQVGAGLWMDVGGASERLNPFDSGVALAAGIGLRVRLWHIPLAFDIGYAILRESALQPADALDSWRFFFRLGEAF